MEVLIIIAVLATLACIVPAAKLACIMLTIVAGFVCEIISRERRHYG